MWLFIVIVVDKLVVRLNDSALVSVNKVSVRWARLVLGWIPSSQHELVSG